MAAVASSSGLKDGTYTSSVVNVHWGLVQVFSDNGSTYKEAMLELDGVKHMLRQMGTPEGQIKTDFFAGL